MTTYDADKLHWELFGRHNDARGMEMIRQFLELHDLEHAHALAEKQRAAEAQWRQSGYEGARGKGWVIDLIDPLDRLLKEHDWDETIFGGFICMTCTPEDPGFDDAVVWPCPPLKAAGLTDEQAVGIIQAHRTQIEAEYKAKQEGQG